MMGTQALHGSHWLPWAQGALGNASQGFWGWDCGGVLCRGWMSPVGPFQLGYFMICELIWSPGILLGSPARSAEPPARGGGSSPPSPGHPCCSPHSPHPLWLQRALTPGRVGSLLPGQGAGTGISCAHPLERDEERAGASLQAWRAAPSVSLLSSVQGRQEAAWL